MVRIESEGSDPVDPLVGCSSFSLFPLSFNPHPPSSTVDAPNPNFDIHSHLKAMVLRSPDKLLKQAKTILDDSMQPGKTSFTASDDKIERVSSMDDKNPQEKRPALGLKRAKFSAKPMPSQPDVVPETNLDIGKLKDPVEFFAAYERMENAKKELQRLRGEPLVDLDQNVPSLSPRRRRPSLFGKSATYKHYSYSSTMVADNGEAFLSSQDKSDKHKPSPIREDVLPETDLVNNSQHVRVSESTPAMTSELNELDELLSCDYGGLDEAGVLDLLQDKLQIKLRDIGKPALPELLDVQRRESETSCDTLPKMTDAITRLSGIRKAAGSKRLSLSSQLIESSVRPGISPAQSSSPLASISLLNRHISKLSPSKDPFSSVDIDLPSVRIPSPETAHGKQSDQFDTRNNLNESRKLVHGEGLTAAAIPPPVSEENVTTQSGKPKEQLDAVGRSAEDGARKDLREHGASTSAAHVEETTAVSGVAAKEQLYAVGRSAEDGARKDLREHGASTSAAHVEETTAVSGVAAKDMSSTGEPKEWMDRAAQFAEVGIGTDLCDFRRSLVHGDQSVADVGKDPLTAAAMQIDHTCGNNKQDNEKTGQVDVAMDSVQEELNTEGLNAGKSTVSGAVEDCTIGKSLTAEDIVMEEPNEETTETSKKKLEKGKKSKGASRGNASKGTVKKGGKALPQSDVPASERTGNKKRKAEVAPRLSKREHLSRRNSLYAAGTKWEAGLRRSTRIRMRPLEYWRGERFLYGRVHDSLVTVIGVKYSSPSKEADQAAVKVKSFVPDEYKELVDLAALH